jgi:hypothetical protein
LVAPHNLSTQPTAMRIHLPASIQRPLALGLLALFNPGLSQAIEYAVSGFGTVGYAQSDRRESYQRFINEEGTFKRDSVLGAQLDARVSSEWSATVQATTGPSDANDEKLSIKVSWAFVSWRPDNDWLVRVGKQRLPLFLNTENRDVGQTYDLLRLPSEVYAVAPTTDLTGASISRTWLSDTGEWTLDAYTGSGSLDVRTSSRDLGVDVLKVRTNASGMSLSLKLDNSSAFHASMLRASTRRRDGAVLTSSFPAVTIPAVGTYYQVSNALPGPGVGTTSHIVNDVFVLGADLAVAPNWRVVSELGRTIQHKSDVGANTVGGYLAVLHKIDRFTPYVSLARLRSLGSPLRVTQALDAVSLPSFIPGADQINLSQRVAADSTPVYDQTALSIGLSYALTPQSKLKGEWMRTRVGVRSAMVDSQAGDQPFNHALIDVLSLSYSFAF